MTDTKTCEAAAIATTLLLARLAPLRFESETVVPTLSFGNYLHAGAAHLLLVPSIEAAGSDNAAIGAAVEAFGQDALVVRAGGSKADDISFDVILAAQPGAWSTPLKLWLGEDGGLHLVLVAPGTTFYALTRFGLNASSIAPWGSRAERDAGYERSQRELTRVLEGR